MPEATPQAMIVATARTPIGRANKGSLVECRPDDLSATIVQAVLDKVPALDPGAAAVFPVRVVPTLAGTVSSGASLLRVDGGEAALAPARWIIAP